MEYGLKIFRLFPLHSSLGRLMGGGARRRLGELVFAMLNQNDLPLQIRKGIMLQMIVISPHLPSMRVTSILWVIDPCIYTFPALDADKEATKTILYSSSPLHTTHLFTIKAQVPMTHREQKRRFVAQISPPKPRNPIAWTSRAASSPSQLHISHRMQISPVLVIDYLSA